MTLLLLYHQKLCVTYHFEAVFFKNECFKKPCKFQFKVKMQYNSSKHTVYIWNGNWDLQSKIETEGINKLVLVQFAPARHNFHRQYYSNS